tara:strand:+ start:109 stop:525 length:417 start_codon:yes stop_codon:yes gene_type:complete
MQIGSFCTNYNHWSDNITIRAYVQDIVVPYFKHTIADLRAADVTKAKPFGEQVCLVLLDCWWAHFDAHFLQWVKVKYAWLRILFVPKGCTPVAQPMDLGIIAKIKGWLRRKYSAYVSYRGSNRRLLLPASSLLRSTFA